MTNPVGNNAKNNFYITLLVHFKSVIENISCSSTISCDDESQKM